MQMLPPAPPRPPSRAQSIAIYDLAASTSRALPATPAAAPSRGAQAVTAVAPDSAFNTIARKFSSSA